MQPRREATFSYVTDQNMQIYAPKREGIPVAFVDWLVNNNVQ